jgi:hypothetical protein
MIAACADALNSAAPTITKETRMARKTANPDDERLNCDM